MSARRACRVRVRTQLVAGVLGALSASAVSASFCSVAAMTAFGLIPMSTGPSSNVPRVTRPSAGRYGQSHTVRLTARRMQKGRVCRQHFGIPALSEPGEPVP
jgi:hypothetical protein